MDDIGVDQPRMTDFERKMLKMKELDNQFNQVNQLLKETQRSFIETEEQTERNDPESTKRADALQETENLESTRAI